MNKLLLGIGVAIAMGSLITHWSAQNNADPQGSNYRQSAQVDSTVEPIPNQAIRLRIIANSDAPVDQQLKRQVRDAIITSVGADLQPAKTIDQARATLRGDVAKYQQIANNVITAHGFHYSINTNYGMVPFPTKLYGNQVYPAGTYEALRIQIGKGQGQNWWCVLFPPLCFVDLADGAAVPNKLAFPDTTALATLQLPVSGHPGVTEKTQVRSLFLDLAETAIRSVSHQINYLIHHIFQ